MANQGDTGVSKSGKPIWFDGQNWMYGTPPERPTHVADANNDGQVGWGEDVGAAIQSGLRRGVAGIAGLPGAIINTMDDARVAMGGESSGIRMPGFPEAQRGVNKAFDAGNDATFGNNIQTDYKPATGTGRYAQTGAEFFVGSPLAGGKAAQALAATGASAAGSQGAADVANFLAPGSGLAEGVARVAGAVGGPMALNAGLKTFTPQQTGTPAHRKAVAALQDDGVQLTGGQVSGNKNYLSQEAATTAGQELIENSVDTFTKAAMQKAIDPRLRSVVQYKMNDFDNAGAVADALDQTRKVMDDLAAGNQLRTSAGLIDDVDTIAGQYGKQVGHYNKSPYFDNIVEDLKKGDLSGQDFQIMRTTLRELAEGGDGVTRNAASKVLTAITDAMETQLAQSGRSDIVDLYRGARQTFRDLKTLERAFGTAGAVETGNITPAALGSSTKARDGAVAMMDDTKSTFSSLVRNGRKALTLPKTSGTAENLQALGAQASGPALAGATIGTSMFGPAGGVIGGVGGAAYPMLRNRMRASGMGQAAAKGLMEFESLPGMSLNTGAARSAVQAPSAPTRPWWEEDEKRR